MLQEMKLKIEAFLPVMKEEEMMGYDPVKIMMTPINQITLETIEITYRAIMICKEKYPEWYSVMATGCHQSLSKEISPCFKK